MNVVLENSKTIATERCEMMEQHVTESFKIERTIFEETSKHSLDAVKKQLEGFESTMSKEGTYRDTVFTEHMMATETRLQDMETRTTDQQERSKQEIVALQEKSVTEVKEQMSTVESKTSDMHKQVNEIMGKMTTMETNLKDNIIHTILELVKQRSQAQLDDDTVLQLQFVANETASEVTTGHPLDKEDPPVWEADESKDDDELSWVDPEEKEDTNETQDSVMETTKDKEDSKAIVPEQMEINTIEKTEKEENNVKLKKRSLTPIPRRRKSDRDHRRIEHRSRSRPRHYRSEYYRDVRDKRCSCPPKYDYNRRR